MFAEVHMCKNKGLKEQWVCVPRLRGTEMAIATAVKGRMKAVETALCVRLFNKSWPYSSENESTDNPIRAFVHIIGGYQKKKQLQEHKPAFSECCAGFSVLRQTITHGLCVEPLMCQCNFATCGTRKTCGVLGFSFWVLMGDWFEETSTTASHVCVGAANMKLEVIWHCICPSWKPRFCRCRMRQIL